MSEIKWLRAGISGKPEGVDRQARVIRGYVVAQLGPFKSKGRGEFDNAALQTIVALGNATARGLKSRLGHPTLSDDGIGKYLGRGRDLRMDWATDARTGQQVPAVRGDLYFDASASKTPHGDLAGYVMDLSESDPDALSSSLVLEANEQHQVDKKGKPLLDREGNALPPLWRPTRLHASDIVDTGDAVGGLLSAKLSSEDMDKLLRFDGPARLGAMLANAMTLGQSRGEAATRLLAFVQRFLDDKYGKEEVVNRPRLDALRKRIEEAAKYLEEK